MFKRLIFYICVLAITATVVLNVYESYRVNLFLPNEKQEINYGGIEEAMSFEDFQKYIVEQEEAQLVIFYDSTDKNSAYMFNSVLPTLFEKYYLTELESFVLVDMENVEIENSQIFKNRYGFSSLPALAKIQYEKGTLTVITSTYPEIDKLITDTQIEKFLLTTEVVQPIPEESN